MKRSSLSVCVCILFLQACGGDSNSEEHYTEESLLSDNTSDSNNTDDSDNSNKEDDLPVNNYTQNPQGDISYQTLTNRNPDCAAYVGQYHAHIVDIQQGVNFESSLVISASEETCTFVSNNIPNHDVGANTSTGKDFASQVSPNTKEFRLTVPRLPARQETPSYVQKIAGRLTLNGILLNGVDLDMDSAFCYHPDINAPLNIGLGTRQQCGLNADWYAVPAENTDIVTLDDYSGHAYDGRYHYHGDNQSLSLTEQQDADRQRIEPSGSPVIGFAPDGFPIYGHFFYDQHTKQLRKAKSSWTTHNTERQTPSGSNVTAPSITTHSRGLFVEDWYYLPNSGDLDECNGMVDAYGNYGYYYTDTYPYGPICTFGIPHGSFTLESNAFESNSP